MSLLELIDEAFDLFKRSGGAAFAITGLMHVPAWVFFGTMNEYSSLAPLVLAAIFLAPVLTNAALTKLQYERYLDNPFSLGDAARAVWRRVIPILATSVLAAVTVALGAAALVVPALLPGVGLFFLWPVVMAEDLYYVRALRRSWDLASGSFGRVLTVFLLAALPYLLLAGLMTAAAITSEPASGTESTDYSTTEDLIMGTIVGLVFALLPLAATTLSVVLYVDLRVRREGFDIERMAHRAGLAAVPPSEGSSPAAGDAPGLPEGSSGGSRVQL